MDISTALLAGTVTAAAGAYYLASSSTTPATLGPIPSRLRVLAAQEAKDTGSKEKHVWSHQMPGRKEGESPVVRSLLSKDELVAFVDPEVHTLYDNFRRGVEKFGNTHCLGHRPTATSPYVWRTFNEVMEEATLVGSALASFEADRHVGICSINRPEWVIVEQAVNAYSMTLVPLYDTFGEESLCYIINQSGMEIVFAHPDRVELMFRCAASSPSLKIVISLGDDISKHEGKVPAGIRLLSFAQAQEIGKANRVPHIPPHEDQVATICYTSGTTGMPKGALLTHKNIIADVVGTMLCGAIVVTPGDVHVSYLPLAHMFERLVITFMLQFGASTGFYRGDVRTLFDDIKVLRPTIFASVPKIYSRIFDKVMNGVSNSAVSRTIFNYAFEVKRKQLPYNQYKHALWDKIVFSKVQDMFGGRIRIMLSGSAPMAYKTIEFLRIVFGCEVFEGYGQTECAAASSVTVPGVATMGCTSVPLPCAEMKLVDVPEMGFLTSNTPPQGEVWVRGHLVFKGYFKNPELTVEALTEDGWLKTGDVGQLNPDGTFQIIDRKKNIFKLSQGEYISPEKVENTLTQSKYVMMAFAYGDSFKSSVVAIIVPDPDVIKAWAATQNIVATVEDLCSNEALKKEILDDINQTCRARKLNGYEIPRAIHLEHRPFTPESEIVTPTMKLKRPFAKRYYEAAINNLYTELNE